MTFLNNSFPDHEIEIKLAVPDNLSSDKLADDIEQHIERVTLGLRRICDVRVHEHLYHYFQTPKGKKIAKIVETPNGEYRSKRKWDYPYPNIPQVLGLVIKREEKAPERHSYEEALAHINDWARDSAVKVCTGSRLAILKRKILVQDLENGRIGQIIFDEARDLDNPRVKTLRQIEIEYKGQAESKMEDDFQSVAISMLSISQRVRDVFPALKYTRESKFKHFKDSQNLR